LAEFDVARTRKSLFEALIDARDRFGRNKVALEDPERQPITYGRLVLGALVLGRKLAGLTKPRENVGVLLPNVQG
jgi:acyl-[acyl-carrier-protein]-phospholipid O-acyltransferase/long-chain-fatty-acid--[acyl-carrier-protein] ligase